MKVFLVVKHSSKVAGHGSSDDEMELVTDAWPYGGSEALAFGSRASGEAFISEKGWRVELLEVEVRP